jgi:hypothetical protein
VANLLRAAIENVMDVDAFNREREQERDDAQYITGVRDYVTDMVMGVMRELE